MMFNDLKITTVLNLPGEVLEVKGFKKDGPRTVSQSIDGAVLLATMKKMIMMDGAEMKKLAASSNEKDLKRLLGPMGAMMDEPDVTVGKLGSALFDYDKEVRDARAAYPALRKALGLHDSVKLPGQ